jgi:integrase
MSESNPTAPARPSKPRPDFPLFPHASGQWAKKIRGKMHYFGLWADPDAALEKYLKERDDLHAGRLPRPDPDALTVKALANHFLNAKQDAVKAGEVAARTWGEYKLACDLLVKELGKGRLVSDLRPDDFAALRNKMAQRWGPHRLTSTVRRVRSVFRHAYEAGLTDAPVRFGPGFRLPSQKVMRLHRAAGGPKLFSAEEARRLIDAAGVQLRAMVLLGVNCGFGNSDVGNLPLTALDLDGGWVDYPRPKTGMPRRCPLWPETVAALREALAKRPRPRGDDAGLVFLTRLGAPWAKETSTNPVAKETRKLLNRLGINGSRNFYTLRHTFRTVADGAKDQPAADHIMGHQVPHMSNVYRETISDERLRAVAHHVRSWMFPPRPEAPKRKGRGKKADAPAGVEAAAARQV